MKHVAVNLHGIVTGRKADVPNLGRLIEGDVVALGTHDTNCCKRKNRKPLGFHVKLLCGEHS
jgi:hypothetical protein